MAPRMRRRGWLAGGAGPHRLAGHEVFHQLGESGRGQRRQAARLLDQGSHQPDQRLAAGPGPQAADIARGVERQRFQRPGQGSRGRLGDRNTARERRPGDHQRLGQGVQQRLGVGQIGRQPFTERGRLGQPPADLVDVARPRPAQAVALQSPPARLQRFGVQAQPHHGVLEDGQQLYRVDPVGRRPGHQARQLARRKARQRRAGRGVDHDAPAQQTRRDPARQHRVRGDKGGGAARRLQRLAQQKGGDAGGLVLCAGGDDRKSSQPFSDWIDAIDRAFFPQAGDLAQPVGGRLGRAQRLVDDPPTPAVARIARRRLRPGQHVAPLDAGLVQQALHRPLRVLFVDLGPGSLRQVLI